MVEDGPQGQDKYKTLKDQTKATRFKPSESGNPGGRPKGESITARLRKILDSEYRDGKTARECIVDTIVKEVLGPSGKYGFNTPLLKEIWERVEGKVQDKLEVTEIQKIEYVPAKEKE